MRNLKCPVDGSEMARIAVEQIDVDHCAKCDGVWFDNFEPELLEILRQGQDKLPEGLKTSLKADAGRLESSESRNLPCPRCGQKMLTYWYAGEVDRTFLVDGCLNGCGVWFDDGELGKAYELVAVPLPRDSAQGIMGRVAALKEVHRRGPCS